MRTPIIIFLLLFLGRTEFSNASGARFYITTTTYDELGQTYMDDFQGSVIKLISQNFPCALIQTRSNATVLLDRERERQVVGEGKENAIENIGESMICDYLISLKIKIDNNIASIDVVCLNPNRAIALFRTSSIATLGEVLNTIDKVGHQLIEGLEEYEICPFTGPVSITINSVLDSTNTVDYEVYCNEMDQHYNQKLEINNTTFSDWKLQRKDRLRTEGTMTFYSNELSKITEENGCYKCKSGREGGRTYTETRSMKVKGNGISHESSFKGKPQDDTRIELKLLENGTYLVIAKGTSQPATGEEKVLSSAVGTCDKVPQETKIIPRVIAIPLKVIFGPYAGNASDKILKQKDTKVFNDPISKEKTTVTIDFTLTQKDH